MSNKKGFIQLVYSKDSNENAHITDRQKCPSGQISLFPTQQPNLVVFVSPSSLSESGLEEIVDTINPRVFIDLRKAPRFDYGSLNRKKVFDLFLDNDIRYLDISDDFNIESNIKSSVHDMMTYIWTDRSGMKKSKKKKGYFGPLILVSDTSNDSDDFKEKVIKVLNSETGEMWDILEY